MPIIDVVKYNGSADIFAWRYPNSDLSSWTQVIVNESQEAILFKGGKALDLLPPGRHVLSNKNIPLISSITNLPFGGKSPFKAEIWFVNKINNLNIKWGTPTPIQIQDPKYNIFIPIKAFGQFGIKIDDSRKFLLKLVGTLSSFRSDDISEYFRGVYLTKAKEIISSYLINDKVSIIEINAHLEKLSEHIKSSLEDVMDDYGIKLVNFYVNSINTSEDDIGVKKLKEALAKKAEMDIIGYNYTQERSFDALEGVAKGGMASGIIGTGIGIGLNNNIGNITNGFSIEETIPCPNCKSPISKNGKFCSQCGYKMNVEEEAKSKKNIKCNKCGSAIPENAKFCLECGDEYTPCLKCGADVDKSKGICSECGAKLPKPCPGCGELVSEGKFCPECGMSLIKKCSKCNHAIEGNPKFCPECGNNL